MSSVLVARLIVIHVHHLCIESEQVQHCHNKTPTPDEKIQCIRMSSILGVTIETNELIECCFVYRGLTGRAMKIVFNSFIDFNSRRQ